MKRMKRIMSLFIAAGLAVSLTACKDQGFQPTEIVPETSSDVSSTESTYSEPETISSVEESFVPPESIPQLVTMQKAGVIYCVEDKKIIESENIHSYIATASTLKLLTASVALKYMNPETVLTVGSELALVPYNSSLCYIRPGQRLRLYDMLIGLLLPSGNDAAYSIAVNVSRAVAENGAELTDEEAVEYFTGLMNDFAFGLGMRNSYFVTPDGSDDPRQFSTTEDMLRLAEYALTVPEIREIVAMPSKYVVFASGDIATWNSTNQLINEKSRFYCPEAIGMKTGSTDAAGLCLIAAFEKDGKTYIISVTGCEDTNERYTKVAEYYAKVGGKIGEIGDIEIKENSEPNSENAAA